MTAPSDPVKPPASSKKRSSTERLLVWGGIIVLLALVGVQAHARFGYDRSRANLLAAMDADSHSGKNEFFSIDQVSPYIVGWPTRDDSHPGEVKYTWSGLGKSYGFSLTYDPKDKERAVLDLVTTDAPLEAAPVERSLSFAEWYWLEQWFPPADRRDYHFNELTFPAYPYEGFRPLRFDDNQDGKLTKAEAPPEMHYCFDKIDANGDGSITQAEVDAVVAKFKPEDQK